MRKIGPALIQYTYTLKDLRYTACSQYCPAVQSLLQAGNIPCISVTNTQANNRFGQFFVRDDMMHISLLYIDAEGNKIKRSCRATMVLNEKNREIKKCPRKSC